MLRKNAKPKPRTLYWHYPLPKPHFLGGRSAGAIRSRDYKLITYFDNGQVQLFNLAKDPGEQTDLSEQFPAIRSKLLIQLQAWRTRTIPNPQLTTGASAKP